MPSRPMISRAMGAIVAKKNKPKPPINPPLCLHCKIPARRVTGRQIYSQRTDLWGLIMWLCKCGAYCGSHKRSGKPLGYPCDAETRNARKEVHKILDPIWRNAHQDPAYAGSEKTDVAIKKIQGSARGRVYAWLAFSMGIEKTDCHTAMFNVDQCRQAWKLCRIADYAQIREWYKTEYKKS